ncbi:MAG: hypothetical protein NTZ97_04055 [Candidatus Moranbacteria bacterium]|nr:hypothetical protein [Candidatus Moranbacteria bacterium]
MSYPKPFRKLIENFAALPSVGPKMAERLVLYLFKQNKAALQEFSENLLAIQDLLAGYPKFENLPALFQYRRR